MNNPEYQIKEPKAGLRKIAILGAGLILTAVVVMGVYYFTKVNKAASFESREVNVTIEKGSSMKEIASQLGEAEVISRPWVFELYARLHGAGNKIQAGSYVLNANMTIPDIVDVLTHGKVVSNARNVTVIEGWTNAQIGSRLAQRQIVDEPGTWAGILQKNQFEFKYDDVARAFNYQGFLFPDTYKLGREEGAEMLAQKMLANFESKFTDKMMADLEAQGRTLKDAIIMASIIEKEVGRNKESLTDEDLAEMQKEREIVASVFYNRLEIGMRLESDATVNYVTGKADRSATIEDTKIKSPYNTYQITGLPPGPISNPGIGSIIAAVYPAESDYIFFLNSPEGKAYFAKTLAEHNENRAKYLR